MYKPSPFRIGNNPGWYGNHYQDIDVHHLMKDAGNLATRYFITIPQWEQDGMAFFTQRIKDVYEAGFRYNLYTFTNQFNTDYTNRDTTQYPAGPSDPPGSMVRTMIPIGIYEPPLLANGDVNPANKWAVYVEAGMKEHGLYFDYFEIWNEPDITYNQGAADDPNLAHDPTSWWNRQPEPWEVWNTVCPVQDYIRLCEVGYKVIKKYKPTAKVCTGGLGFPAYGYWFHKLGGAQWYDVLSIHMYPQFFLREWDNQLGFVYHRHSDYAANWCINRLKEWQKILTQFSVSRREIICSEINLPRFSSDPNGMSGDMAQVNWTIKTLLKFYQHGLSRTWLFVAGESATPPNATEFQTMGLYMNLITANPGQEVKTGQGIVCATLWKLLENAVYDNTATASLNFYSSKIDGLAMKLPSGKKALILWAKTTQDMSENANWSYMLPPHFNTNFNVYQWNYSQTNSSAALSGRSINLSATPVILIET
jgi:hypothetical protein